MDDLRKRRLSYSEICNLAMEEQGYGKETFSKFAEENPALSELSTFINSLLFKGYDDSRKTIPDEFLEDCVRIGVKLPRLIKKFRKNLKVPKEFTEGQENSTESPSMEDNGLESNSPNSFVLIILESFLISLSTRFTTFEQNFSAQRNALSLILSDVPANFTHKKTAAVSPLRPFELTKERNIQ